MLDVLLIEFLKLRRSLVLLLCIAAPVFVAIICFLLLLDAGNRGLEWDRFLASGSAMWAYFMLPMSVTAITVLVAQVEHGPKAWNFLLSQPVPRWQIFAAKLIVVLILLAAMSVALYGLLYGAGFLSQATLKALSEMLAAAGIHHPSDLRPHHLARRISQTEIKLFSQLHVFLRPGELLT
ncbi:MAG: ABC transporter permease, partial [Brevundimonas sp.]